MGKDKKIILGEFGRVVLSLSVAYVRAPPRDMLNTPLLHPNGNITERSRKDCLTDDKRNGDILFSHRRSEGLDN